MQPITLVVLQIFFFIRYFKQLLGKGYLAFLLSTVTPPPLRYPEFPFTLIVSWRNYSKLASMIPSSTGQVQSRVNLTTCFPSLLLLDTSFFMGVIAAVEAEKGLMAFQYTRSCIWVMHKIHSLCRAHWLSHLSDVREGAQSMESNILSSMCFHHLLDEWPTGLFYVPPSSCVK